jgi:hypothetical protein
VNTLDPNIGAQVPPKFLRPDFERMPRELTPLKNWVLWVPIWNGSKWTKRPIQPSGFGASTTNPKHWSSFDTVKQAYERAAERGYIELRGRERQRVAIGGVGLVFDGQPDAFARRVGVSPITVHNWINEGLPSAKIGARRLIHIDTADNWLKVKLGIKPVTMAADGQ